MIAHSIEQSQAARLIRFEHGRRAEQYVVDRIFESVQNADLDAAKWWDVVGSHLEGIPQVSSPCDQQNS